MHSCIVCSTTKVVDPARIGEWEVEWFSEAGDKRSKHEANNAIIMRLALTLTTDNVVCEVQCFLDHHLAIISQHSKTRT